MRKILISAGTLVFIGALVASATGAFFSDTETSTGNTFAAGSLDLLVDSEAHYNGLVCRLNDGNGEDYTGYRWREPALGIPTDAQLALDVYDQECNGTWDQKDLGPGTDLFFNLGDIKPGDEGENTISLHVYDNDAWGRFLINDVVDVDHDCTEPEEESDADTCVEGDGDNTTNGSGELANNIRFWVWLDQGETPGFQNVGPEGSPTGFDDPGEGDNVWQCDPLINPEEFSTYNPSTCDEPLVILPGSVDNDLGNPEPDETHNIWTALVAIRAALDSATICNTAPANGHVPGDTEPYGECNGLAVDGRLVGSTTYFFGLGWDVPSTVGNEAQTDSLSATLIFEVEQHRNNSGPFGS